MLPYCLVAPTRLYAFTSAMASERYCFCWEFPMTWQPEPSTQQPYPSESLQVFLVPHSAARKPCWLCSNRCMIGASMRHQAELSTPNLLTHYLGTLQDHDTCTMSHELCSQITGEGCATVGSALEMETAAYALLTRALRATYADCTTTHTFLDPLCLPRGISGPHCNCD